MGIKQELKQTETELSFADITHRKTINNSGVPVLIASVLILSYIAGLGAGIYRLILDFSWSAVGELITSALVGVIFPLGPVFVIALVGKNTEERFVFDKAANQFRCEVQRRLYWMPLGNPKCLQSTSLSNISQVSVGNDVIQANTLGTTQTYRFDTVDIYIKDEGQPFCSISLAKYFGHEPYQGLMSPEQIVQQIREFLNLKRPSG